MTTDLTTRTPDPLTLAAGEADPYAAAFAIWLEGHKPSTRRNYQTAWRLFGQYTDRHPGDVTPLDVTSWKEHLKHEGRSDTTIANRLSALSSFYAYLQRPQADGQPIQAYNPVDGVGRDDLEISPYERARKIGAEDFQAILAQIDVGTIMGARDRAMFLFYVICGRRRREVANLRGADLRVDGGHVVYRVRLKRGKVKWKEMPPPVWDAIKAYLTLAGRVLADDTPLFVATVDNGDYLRAHYAAPSQDDETPITGEAIEQALVRYATRAGVTNVTLHSLRHLGAELYHKASGGDVRQTQLFLDHANLNTTQIYLDQLSGEDHRHWQAMANVLGV